MKKIIIPITIGLCMVVLSLTGCAQQPSVQSTQSALADNTLTGKVTAIDGTKITLTLGTLSSSPNSASGRSGGSSDTNQSSSAEDSSQAPNSGVTPPAMPSGDQNASGNQNGGGTPPAMPSGDHASGGQNGGDFTLTAIKQQLTGAITCDNISKVALVMTQNSFYTGAVDTANTAKAATVSLDSTATWKLTADSYVISITDALRDCSNILSQGHNIYYDASNSANAWLGGKTITLNGGGQLVP
jgi:hypothetical protein